MLWWGLHNHSLSDFLSSEEFTEACQGGRHMNRGVCVWGM